MSIIAVMNRKGGCGKSTLAIHLAAWWATCGGSVALANTDRQRSAQAWLSRRSHEAASISMWLSDLGKAFPATPSQTHVVVDTPGGIHGLELARHLARADAVVVPVGPSVFDLETSADFFRELLLHPRVASGRCRVALIGMRWSREASLAWQSSPVPAALPLLTVIPDDAIYRSCLDSGNSFFDEGISVRSGEMRHWTPLLEWLERVFPASACRGMDVKALGAAMERPPPVRAHLVQTARPPGRHRAIQPQMSLPEAFIETQPPDGLAVTDLLAAGVPSRRPQALPKGKPAEWRVARRPTQDANRYVLEPMPKLKSASKRASAGQPGNWLARLFVRMR